MFFKRFLCLCVLGSIWGLLQAQTKIRVVDKKNNSPLVGVNIVASKSTITDEEGLFYLDNLGVLLDSDTIVLSHIGYETKQLLGKKIGKEDTIYLIPKSYPIEELRVSKERVKYESVDFDEMAPLMYGVFAFGATLVGDSIYVIGGDATIKDERYSKYLYEHNSSKLQIYDIKNDRWSIADTKFSSRAYHNVHYANGKIYVLGGKRLGKNPMKEYLNDIVEIYDIKQELLISSKSNPHQAVNFASGLYNDAIIVMNGSTKKYQKKSIHTNQVHLFDLKTGYWYEMESIPYAYETTAIVVDSLLYQIGGFNNNVAVPYINVYHPLTRAHRTEAVLPFGLERPALAYSVENKTIYIFERFTLLAYNLESKEMHSYRLDLGLIYSEMVCKGNYLYIIGGKVFGSNSEVNVVGPIELPGGIISAPSQRLFRIDINTLASTKSRSIPYRRNMD